MFFVVVGGLLWSLTKEILGALCGVSFQESGVNNRQMGVSIEAIVVFKLLQYTYNACILLQLEFIHNLLLIGERAKRARHS